MNAELTKHLKEHLIRTLPHAPQFRKSRNLVRSRRNRLNNRHSAVHKGGNQEVGRFFFDIIWWLNNKFSFHWLKIKVS